MLLQGMIVKPHTLGRRNGSNFDAVEKALGLESKALADLRPSLYSLSLPEQAINLSMLHSPSRKGNTNISEITEVLEQMI